MDRLLNRTLPLPRRVTVWQRIFALLSLSRQRHDLSKLDAHLLRDIGLTQEQARTESQKPIWDAPDHWLR